MTIELPEHLRNGPLAEAAARALNDAASMASASNSVPRISLRGREFRFIENGEEVLKLRDSVDVIMMGVEPGPNLMIKTYYAGAYTSGAKEPPTCASDDGIAPSAWVQSKQSDLCKTCKWNQFGSAVSPSGKATKKCRDSKRVWLKLADSNVVNGQPLKLPDLKERTLYGMNISVASLKAFSEHGRKLASMGQGPAVCVTRVKMLDMEYPQVDFEIAAWLDAVQAPLSLAMSAERPWKIFSNAGLALAAPDAAKPGLPSALPGQQSVGQPPAHLQQATQPASEVVDSVQLPVTPTPAKPVSNQDIDDAVGKW
jgi:hypothetical protein